MFHGPSGTGKTLAAEVIARETGLDLYHVDLSQIVDKYVGEIARAVVNADIARLRGHRQHQTMPLWGSRDDRPVSPG